MSTLVQIAEGIDRFIERVGRIVSWLSPLVVVLAFGLVVARYLFATSSVALSELVLWLHAAVFLVGSAFALTRNAHVRVDVLRPRLGARGRAWVELLGTVVFLLPFALFLIWISWDYVVAAWRIDEGSREPGGLSNVWLLKALIPVTGVLLVLAGLAMAARAIAILHGQTALQSSAESEAR